MPGEGASEGAGTIVLRLKSRAGGWDAAPGSALNALHLLCALGSRLCLRHLRNPQLRATAESSPVRASRTCRALRRPGASPEAQRRWDPSCLTKLPLAQPLAASDALPVGSRPGSRAQEGAAAGEHRAGSASGGYPSAARRPEGKRGSGRREGNCCPSWNRSGWQPQPASSPSSCCVIPAGNALTRQIRALPGLGSAGGGGGDPRTSFYQINLIFPFSCSGLWRCWGPEVPTHGEPPLFSHSTPSPSSPSPSLPARDPLERGRRGAAGARPPWPRAARAAPAGPGRWQAGHGASCRTPRWEAFVLLPGASLSGFQGIEGSLGAGAASSPPQGRLRVVPCPALASPWDRPDSALEVLVMGKDFKSCQVQK